LLEELKNQGITNYELWDGIYLPSIKQSINVAHKQIIEYADVAEFDEVCIGEDDLKFTAPGAWGYFLEQKPKDFDIYLGGTFMGIPDENNMVKDFAGLTLYIVAKRFYERFLSTPDDDHLDRVLSGLGKYVVCNPIVVTQYDGVSGNTGKFEAYEGFFKNRNLFGG